MVLGYPTSTSFPRVDGWSTNPRVLGRHRFNPIGVPSSPSYDMVDDHAFPSSFHSTSPFHQTVFDIPERQPSHDIHTMQGMPIFILHEIKYIFIFMMILLNSVIITLTDDDYIDDDAMQLCVMIVPPFRRSAHTHRVR